VSANRMTLNERLMYSTVRIHGRGEAGEEVGGTGFFVSHPCASGVRVRMLVTNRHVVGALVCGALHLHRPRAAAEGGRLPPAASVPVRLEDFGRDWVAHPDPGIDLCALPYGVVDGALRAAGREVYETFFESSQVIPPDEASAGLDAAEEVHLIGYPEGVCGDDDSLPVFRRGTVASHPRADYRGRPEVLIDVAASDGYSGAPVVVLDREVTRQGWGDRRPVTLLGVLTSGLGRGPEGVVKDDLVFRTGKRKLSPSTMHLCAAVKARGLLALADAVAAKAACR
jgi:hypothetical protein